MRYYSVRVLCATDESREYYKVNSGEYDPSCSLDMLDPRPLKLHVKQVVAYYQHSDKRAVFVRLKDGDELVIAMSFDKFDAMVMNSDYQTLGENKIAK
jgi:hypothetical protein